MTGVFAGWAGGHWRRRVFVATDPIGNRWSLGEVSVTSRGRSMGMRIDAVLLDPAGQTLIDYEVASAHYARRLIESEWTARGGVLDPLARWVASLPAVTRRQLCDKHIEELRELWSST